MAGIAIIIGIFVFLLSGAIISDVTHVPGAGVLPGIVLGILAARPMFKLTLEQRANFLHPAPREYNIPANIAFAKIRDYLAEVSYNSATNGMSSLPIPNQAALQLTCALPTSTPTSKVTPAETFTRARSAFSASLP